MRELVNEQTGESLSVEAYVTGQRAIERRIFRLDNAIADLKATLKQTKGERDKEVAALRANAREIKLLLAQASSSKRSRKVAEAKS